VLLNDEDELIGDSEWVWRVLERRADWEPATRLLQELVQATPAEKRASAVNRAVALVPTGDRLRTLPLARALQNAGQGAAAVPLFESVTAQPLGAERRTVTREMTGARRSVLRQQFQTEINQQEWRRAEQTWSALLQLEPVSLDSSSTFSSTAWAMVQLASAAAQSGDGADVLRFWRTAANLDRSAGLSVLSGFPLTRYRAELTEFYQRMAGRDPASWVPAALEKLRQ